MSSNRPPPPRGGLEDLCGPGRRRRPRRSPLPAPVHAGSVGRLLSFLSPLLFLGGGLVLAVAALCGRVFLALVHLVVEDGTNCLLTGGIVGCGIEQLVDVGGTALCELVHQVPARDAFEEGIDNLAVGDARELGALLGEASHVVAQGFIGLLLTPSEIPGVSGAHLGALKVVHEDLD